MEKHLKRVFQATIVVVLLVTVVLAIAILVVTLDKRAKLSYLGKQLNCEASWTDIETCFKGHFRKGMSQDEVYDILLKLDPQLKETLGKDLHCSTADCCEFITPFHDRVGGFFEHILCFDKELNFLLVSLAS